MRGIDSSTESHRPGGAVARLLVPSTPVAAGILAFVAVCLLLDTSDFLSYDTFTHLHVGEHMLREGELVETDPGIWAVDNRYLDHEWIPQLVMAALHLTLGFEGLLLFIALMVGLTFALLALWMRELEVGPLVTAVLLAGAFSSIYIFMLARPFLLTWVLAVLWTLLLERVCRGALSPARWLAAAVALMLVWANLHAGFLLGFFVLGLFGLAMLWRFATARGDERRRAGRLFLWLFGGGELVLFASGLNPYGFKLHGHMIVYMANTRLITEIREWQAPYFHDQQMVPLLLWVALALAICVAGPRRLAAWQFLLLFGLLTSALRAQRNLPLFVLLTVPAVGLQLEGLLAAAGAESWTGRLARRLRGWSSRLAAGDSRRRGLATAAAVGLAAFFALGLAKARPMPMEERRFPVAAARFVDDNPRLFRGRMFNRYRWGGYLAYALDPVHKVFVNGLQDHYGAAHYWTYAEVSRAQPKWQQILAERGVDWVIFSARSPLAATLDLHPGWRRVYEDKLAEIFVRDASTPPATAAALEGEGERRNALLVVVDTARADAVGAYGAGDDVTPALDRLAREGTVFTHARTTSAWTLPAHGSLFTGLYPSRHGAHWENEILDGGQTTLAEVLASSHQTAAFSENPHITRAKGFDQGFATFEETWRRSGGEEGSTLDRVERWLAERDGGRPFFLFVNLMTPHLPYRPPPEWQERFLPAGVSEAEVKEMRAFGEREARRFMAGELALGERRLEILRALYRADVAHADHQVSRLLEMLAAAGELDRTLVAVVADHGENIGDHGLMEHQLCLYETLLRVPMIFRLPGVVAAGREDNAAVQLIDVLPTVLDALGVARERWPATEGASVLRGVPPPERPVFAEYMRPLEQRALFAQTAPDFDFEPWDRRLKSIQVGALKLIVSDQGPPELYDLASDPGETVNLATAQPGDVAALRQRMKTLVAAWVPRQTGKVPPRLDEETRQALRALGYID